MSAPSAPSAPLSPLASVAPPALSAPPSRRFRSAARAILRFPEPESWLDVGTGDARFPETAREFFPYTSFDGLDRTARVEWARRAERVEEAHIGLLTDPRIAARLRGRYDVVSMLHHLPHAPDPREELDAALAVLRPGGHLLLELPDPQGAFAVLLGERWLPRRLRLHLPSLDELRTDLESRGCTVVATDRRTAHRPEDLSAALAPMLPRVLPAWARAPLPAAAGALEHALAPLLGLTRHSNTYRLIARR